VTNNLATFIFPIFHPNFFNKQISHVCVCVCLYIICAFCSFLNLRWKESRRLVMRMMSTWHWISSIFNHQKIHSIYLSFSCTSFLSIFYQKMITCNLVILQFILYIIPWKQAGRQPRLHIMQWSRWTDNWSVSTFISSNRGECSCYNWSRWTDNSTLLQCPLN